MNELDTIIQLCELSYNKPNEITDKYFIFFQDETTDAQCYIFYDHYTNYITFRGTSSLQDWLIDLDCSTVSPDFYNNEKIQVHNGFYKQYSSIRQHILTFLFQSRHRKIVVCGHSLGGALATLCALDIVVNLVISTQPIVVTIGSPRVGNKEFVKLYQTYITNSIRLTNSKDPIPYFPMSFRFNHTHKSICFKDGNIIQKKRLRGFVMRLMALVKNVNVSSAIEKHSLETYKCNFLKKK